jgi:uncharacterized repeat protein (TIGR04042 family)
MPSVHFSVQLPDGLEKDCYSPSTIVREHFHAGDEMPMSDFVAKSRVALAAASERVRQKFGFSCSSAADQLAEIELWSRAYPPDARVRVLSLT